jgi:hypothetical protein
MPNKPKRNKAYKPKPISRCIKIEPMITHHSGYVYKKSEKDSFIAILEYFCQNTYDAHLIGKLPPPFPTGIPLISRVTEYYARQAYERFRMDYLNGNLQIEAEIVEE